MTKVVLAVVVLAGCQQIFDLDAPARRPLDAQPDDAAVDAPADADVDAPVDARACPTAPEGCAQFSCAASSSCYYICGTAVHATWGTARDKCVSDGLGCLVTLDSQAELDCLAPLNATFLDQIYIGYRQPPNSDEPLGDWQWECGSSNFVTWANNEPNNFSGEEDCGAIVNNKMVDSDCLSDWRYVCELP